MIKAENKICERCKCSFECRADDIFRCACYKIKLSDKEMEIIKLKYTDCLCVNCLMKIVQECEYDADE